MNKCELLKIECNLTDDSWLPGHRHENVSIFLARWVNLQGIEHVMQVHFGAADHYFAAK